MSNSDSYENDDNEPSNPDADRASKHKKLVARNAELEASNAEGLAAKRELLFIKAGVPSDSKMGEYFRKGYDGELSVDAIRVAAAEAKLIADPFNDPAVEAERAAAVRVAEAGRVNEGAVVPADFASRVAAAKSPAELEQIAAEVNAGKPI